MSNTEIDPAEYEGEHVTCAEAIDIITAREVPLGGPRAMKVRRTIPQRKRSLIGPWCFVDHFGPDDVATSGGMSVPRHPHTGLATVTLLFEGHIEHIDSTDFANVVRPAEVNLMIAGTGVSHSEFSSPDTTTLHGVQLWYALPDGVRHSAPGSQHHVAERAGVPGGEVMTYLGTCAGITSPVRTRVDALAAQVDVRAGESVEIEVDTDFEHGVLLDSGDLVLVADGHRQAVAPTELAHLPEGGPGTIRLEAGDEPVRAILIGGRPFGEKIVMWWNFVGRDHDEIVAYRQAWQTEIGAEEFPSALLAAESGTYGGGTEYPQFGTFPQNQPAPLPAPALPNARIKPREQ